MHCVFQVEIKKIHVLLSLQSFERPVSSESELEILGSFMSTSKCIRCFLLKETSEANWSNVLNDILQTQHKMHVLNALIQDSSFPNLTERPEKAVDLPKIVYNLSPAIKPIER